VDEVASALQKSIRRGKEKEAFYWAFELCPKYEAYLWKRLLTISYEDVSALVQGDVPASVSQMRDDYFLFREMGDIGALLVLANAVLLLSRARKTRVADHFLISMGFKMDNGWRIEIPDYAVDKHTLRGRKLKRGGEHFASEGTRLRTAAEDIADPYKNEFNSIQHTSSGRINSFAWTQEKCKKSRGKKKGILDNNRLSIS